MIRPLSACQLLAAGVAVGVTCLCIYWLQRGNLPPTMEELARCELQLQACKQQCLPTAALQRDWNRQDDLEKRAAKAVWMSQAEIALITAFVQPTHTYVEWGTGGSTFQFASLARRAFSIEHSVPWCLEVQALLAEHDLRLTFDASKSQLDTRAGVVDFTREPMNSFSRMWMRLTG
eukprot:m.60738 g.60738  ORF g.60738 m.60738 type:complete len:176 (-) comp16117_c0_seq1:333-860(-)